MGKIVLAVIHVCYSGSTTSFVDNCRNYKAKDDQAKGQFPVYNPASVYIDGKSMRISREIDPEADVYGFFNDQLSSTGWGVLEFRAGYGNRSSSVDTDIIFKAAGYFEGYLTANQIQRHRCSSFLKEFTGKHVLKKSEEGQDFHEEAR